MSILERIFYVVRCVADIFESTSITFAEGITFSLSDIFLGVALIGLISVTIAKIYK